MIKKAFCVVLLPLFALAEENQFYDTDEIPAEFMESQMDMEQVQMVFNQDFNEADHFASFESDEHFRKLREDSLSKLGKDAVPGRFSWLFDAKNFGSEDPYDMGKLEALHQLVQQMQVAGKQWEDEPNIPETERPIFLTQKMYEDLFWKSVPSKPWMISFVKKFRSQAHLNHSDWTGNTFKILAEDLKGQVRFGFIDPMVEELLKEAFDIKTVPQNFLIKDGRVYEMQALSIGYKPVREFITHTHLDPEFLYQSFDIPAPLNVVTLRLKYVWNHYMDEVYVPYVYGKLRDWLIQNEYYNMYPEIDMFFTALPTDQAKSFLMLAVGVVVIQFFFLSLMCMSCCSKTQKVDDKKEKRA